SIMLAAAFAAFFTGVTEPLEFSFMFVAPVLYVIHAFLTGVSVFIAASMHWIAGFGFSAGLVDMVLSSRNPLAQQWYMLILQGFAFSAVYYFVFRFAIVKFNLKTPGREDDEEDSLVEVVSSDNHELAKKYLKALGGHANLVTVDACITRLRLTMKDRSLADERVLKALGAKGVVKLGETNLQVILGPQAEIIATEMKRIPATEDLTNVIIPTAKA
ncbi:MAG: glucose PTS transporter subunit EIIB, partial [Plesiomonas sp.]